MTKTELIKEICHIMNNGLSECGTRENRQKYSNRLVEIKNILGIKKLREVTQIASGIIVPKQ
jgi:hypothetical protein